LFETTDHKPDTPEEQFRIWQNGGEIRTQCYCDGVKTSRVYKAGEDFPGLGMARSLGDNVVKACGVIATPEITMTEVHLDENPFILLASDGIFEFLDCESVVKSMIGELQDADARLQMQELHQAARKRWLEEDNDYCDDMTTVFVNLRQDINFRLGRCENRAGDAGRSSINTCCTNAAVANSEEEHGDTRQNAKKQMKQSYADLKARMAEFSKDPSQFRKKLMESASEELKSCMARLKDLQLQDNDENNVSSACSSTTLADDSSQASDCF